MITRDNKATDNEKREIARLVILAREGGVSDGYAGKRKAARVMEPMFLEVTTDPNKPDEAWGVTMHDISHGGVSFWSRKALPMNNRVYVRECTEFNSRPWLTARIRHRTQAIQGQLIGAEFDAGEGGIPAIPKFKFKRDNRFGPRGSKGRA